MNAPNINPSQHKHIPTKNSPLFKDMKMWIPRNIPCAFRIPFWAWFMRD